MRTNKKVVLNDAFNRNIFHTKRSRLHGLALCGLAFFILVALLGYLSYTYSCGNATIPCQVPFYPHQG